MSNLAEFPITRSFSLRNGVAKMLSEEDGSKQSHQLENEKTIKL
jgi:hypothetical protein